MPSPIIEVKNVSKSYGGVKANIDISIDVLAWIDHRHHRAKWLW